MSRASREESGAIAASRWREAEAQSAPQCLRDDQIQQRFIHNAYGTNRDGKNGVGGLKDEQLLDFLELLFLDITCRTSPG